MIYRYFLPFHGLLFHSIDCAPWCTEVFNFDSPLYFFFVAFAFIQEIIAKFNVIKLSPNRSFIYFELMFVYDVREGLFFDFGHVDIQFSKHHLLKTVFFPLHDFGTLVTPS